MISVTSDSCYRNPFFVDVSDICESDSIEAPWRLWLLAPALLVSKFRASVPGSTHVTDSWQKSYCGASGLMFFFVAGDCVGVNFLWLESANFGGDFGSG